MTQLVVRAWCVIYWGKGCAAGGGRHNCDELSHHEPKPHRCECGDTRAVGLVFR